MSICCQSNSCYSSGDHVTVRGCHGGKPFPERFQSYITYQHTQIMCYYTFARGLCFGYVYLFVRLFVSLFIYLCSFLLHITNEHILYDLYVGRGHAKGQNEIPFFILKTSTFFNSPIFSGVFFYLWLSLLRKIMKKHYMGEIDSTGILKCLGEALDSWSAFKISLR